jgi:3-oxoacyl-[acyl-carrier protein] reductase
MDLRLVGLRALVTGATRGIGRGIVTSLAQEGAEVIFCGRNTADGEALSGTLGAGGCKARFISADVATKAGISTLAEMALADGKIDILVNNAGSARGPAPKGGFERTIPEDWEDTLNRSLMSAVRLIGLFLPQMRNAGWGRVINISSISGLEPGSIGPPDYSAAKAAINTMTVSLAARLTGTGVTANVISPGSIVTEAVRSHMEAFAAREGWTGGWADIERRFATELMPLKTTRIGRPSDIGAAVAFLSSPVADFITGAHLRIDGGVSQAAI